MRRREEAARAEDAGSTGPSPRSEAHTEHEQCRHEYTESECLRAEQRHGKLGCGWRVNVISHRKLSASIINTLEPSAHAMERGAGRSVSRLPVFGPTLSPCSVTRVVIERWSCG